MTLEMDRRRFLRWMGLGLGATAAGCAAGRDWEVAAPGSTSTTATTTTLPVELAPAPMAPLVDTSRRVLVVLELQGGNDGLATAVPGADPALAGLRGDLVPDLGELHDLDGYLGLHPALANVAPRLSVLQGVGSLEPDLSHFESFRRLWEGDPSGTVGYPHGFLGRCCDALMGDEQVTGVSLGWGPTPALRSAVATTAALPGSGVPWFLDDQNEWLDPYRAGLDAVAAGEPVGGLRKGLDFVELLQTLPDPDGRHPDTELGARFGLAGRLLRADVGIRILHVPFGDFDTHDDQRSRHDQLMAEIDGAVSSFLREVDDAGMSDRVLVATTSEFGRRVERNGSGTDHGAASVALVAGPGGTGVVGEAPSLTRLDEEGNLATTVPLDDYLATLAECWMGIPRSEVLEGDPVVHPELVGA
ncbi:MAG: DUF1501 domain-containing protein [Actinomycetota bacterium]